MRLLDELDIELQLAECLVEHFHIEIRVIIAQIVQHLNFLLNLLH